MLPLGREQVKKILLAYHEIVLCSVECIDVTLPEEKGGLTHGR